MKNCACTGSFLDKMLQPILLVSLKSGSSHGFQLLSDIARSGMISNDSIDPAGMYRTLKRMESDGLVTSYWDTEGAAKPRRIYSITEKGGECLGEWERTLREHRNSIDVILRTMERSKKQK